MGQEEIDQWGSAIPSIEKILQYSQEQDEKDPVLVNLSNWTRPTQEDLNLALQYAKHLQKELGWTDKVLDRRYKSMIPPKVQKNNNDEPIKNRKKEPTDVKTDVPSSTAVSPVCVAPEALSKALQDLKASKGLASEDKDEKKQGESRLNQFIERQLSFLSHKPDLEKFFQNASSNTSLIMDEDLTSISTEINTSQFLSKNGNVTALDVHEEFISLGFGSGITMIIDHYQRHVFSIPATQSCGTVTAVAHSPEGEHFLIGYESGLIRLWDLKSKREIKAMDVLFGNAIDHIHFLQTSDAIIKFLAVNQNGMIKMCTITKVLFTYTVDFADFISTGKQSVMFLKPLLPRKTFSMPTDEYQPIAFATKEQICIVGLVDSVAPLDVVRKPACADETCIPLFSWRAPKPPDLNFSISSATHKNQRLFLSNAAYAIAWSNEVIVKVIAPLKRNKSARKLGIKTIMTFKCETSVKFIGWIEHKILFVLCSDGTVSLLDPSGNSMLEVFDRTHGMDFYLPDFDSKEAHELISSSSSSVVVLCRSRVGLVLKRFKLRSWDERVEVLAESERWEEALGIGLQFVRNRERLDATQSSGRATITDRLLIVLLRYLIHSLAKNASKLDIVKRLALLSVDFCIQIGRTEFLFSEIEECFRGSDAENIFLEAMEVFVLNDRLITLEKSVLNNFIAYFCNIGRQKEIDRTLLHLDPRFLPVDFLLNLCKENQLEYSSIYVKNLGQKDFVSPIAEFSKKVSYDPDFLINSAVGADRALLVYFYLKSLFIGKIFPLGGDLLPYDKLQARYAVVDYLFCQENRTLHSLIQFDPESFFICLQELFNNYPDWFKDAQNLRNSQNRQEEEEKNTDILLETVSQVTSQVTNAVTSAVANLEKQIVERTSLQLSGSLFRQSVDVNADVQEVKQVEVKQINGGDDARQVPKFEDLPGLQRISDILISLTRSPDFHVQEKSFIFEFLSKYVALSKITVDETCLNSIFQQLLIGRPESGNSGGHNLSRSDREERLVKLLQIFSIKGDKEDFISKALSAKLFKVCDYVYRKDGDLLNQLRVTILDPSLRDVFEFVSQILQEDFHSKGLKSEVRKEVTSNFKVLIQIDLQNASRMVAKNFPNDAEILMNKLSGNPDVQFMFLRTLYHLFSNGESEIDFSSDKNRKLHEKYISMLCKSSPHDVYSHLIENENYELSLVMQECKTLNIRDAYAFLLERTGDLAGALQINLDNLCDHLEKCELIEENGGDKEKEALRSLKVAAELCERASNRKEPKALSLWNQVLVTLVKMQLRYQKMSSKTLFYQLLVRAVREFVETMSVHIPIEQILKSIFDSGSGLKYRQYKDVIDQILFSFSCDTVILTQAQKCISADLYESTYQKVGIQSAAPIIPAYVCKMCNKQIDIHEAMNSSSRITVFQCGHLYHSRCLAKNRCAICSKRVMGSSEVENYPTAEVSSQTAFNQEEESKDIGTTLFERFESLFQRT